MTGRQAAARNATRRFAVIGLIASLVIALAGVISYRANKGLPFQSTYRVTVDVPDAARLVVNNAVRIDGVRVGQVDRVTAMPGTAATRPFARLALRLQGSVGELPRDTGVQVRTASPIGGTFVDLQPGRSGDTVPDGGRLGLARAQSSVQVTDLLDIFDGATRRGIRGILRDTGPGFAGRGGDLNQTIGDTSRLMAPAQRVLGVTADPRTQLSRFLDGYESTVREFAAAPDELASLLRGAGRTFAALDADRSALRTTLERLQPAEVSAANALEGVRGPLRELTGLARSLRPGARRLAPAVHELNRTLRTARPPLRSLPRVAKLLEGVLRATDQLSRAPETRGTLRQLIAFTAPLERLFSAVTPAQVSCNIYGVFAENVVSVLGGTGTKDGSFELASVSSTGAQNELFQNATISPDLNVNATPNLNDDECESGNEPYSATNPFRGNPPGLQYDKWRETTQPAGVRGKAQAAGLYDSPGEAGR